MSPLDRSPAWLRDGTVTGIGRVPAGSNATFAVSFDTPDGEQLAIYKPRAGERPLWDFPDGTLYQREAAAYLVSEALGWGIIPPTIVREGPYGIGSFQLYVPPDEKRDYWRVRRKRQAELIRLALFDVITNNADRKGEHCHLAADGTIYGIDNGLTFHTDFKCRTVLVEYAGQPVPPNLAADLAQLVDNSSLLEEALAPLLDDGEIAEFLRRTSRMSRAKKLPRVQPHWELYYLMAE